MIKFIPTRIHGIIDYLFALILIALPALFAPSVLSIYSMVCVSCAIFLTAYSVNTDYEWALNKVIPMPIHLYLDTALGIFLVVSPWLFNFPNSAPFIVLGLYTLLIAAVSSSQPSGAREDSVEQRALVDEFEDLEEPLGSRKGRAAFSKTQGSEVEDPYEQLEEYVRQKEAERES